MKSQREKAEALIDQQEPTLLIGSPMCTVFSAIQAINVARRDPAIVEREKVAGRVHLQWCCYLYRKQIARGMYFLQEHPNGATSWMEPCVLEVLGLDSVKRIRADQCQHGQESDAGNPIKKPTGFMSNAPHLLEALDQRCFGRRGACSRPQGGRHQDCLGKVARRAAIFSDLMCEIILSGFSAQLRADKRMRENEVGINHVMLEGSDEIELFAKHVSELNSPPLTEDDGRRGGRQDEQAIEHPRKSKHVVSKVRTSSDSRASENDGVFAAGVNRHERFVDDITGQPLDPELCRIARKKELDYFHSKGVWDMRRISEAWAKTGRPPITVRWVEVNKGDDEAPNYRSRLVAREIRMAGEDAIFAPTPPLE